MNLGIGVMPDSFSLNNVVSTEMSLREESPEVLYCSGSLVGFDQAIIDELKVRAARNPRKRCRICAHPDPTDVRHDMLIAHQRNCYVRPHRHRDKSETIHVVEGDALLLIYSPAGDLIEIHHIGPAASGNRFLFRTPINTFHALAIVSDWFLFHETASGPFDPGAQEYAPWSQAAKDWLDEVALSKQLRDLAADYERIQQYT